MAKTKEKQEFLKRVAERSSDFQWLTAVLKAVSPHYFEQLREANVRRLLDRVYGFVRLPEDVRAMVPLI